jgi:serine/threonine protein kinase
VYGETAVEGVRKGQAGYAHLCSLFAASAVELGFSLPSVAFDKFPSLVPDKYLGRGATSKVFLAKQDGTDCVVKMFHDACKGLVANEAKVLTALTGIDGVPRLEDVSQNALLMTPVCSRYKVVDRDSVSQLLDVVKAVHDKGYVHRDIRPPNLLQTIDGVVMLADWGFAAVKDSTAKYVGTLHTASDAVLASIESQRDHRNTASDDLHALIRCIFCLLYPRQVGSLWAIANSDVADIRGFWSVLPKAWLDMATAANVANYDAVRSAMCALLPAAR